jgi:hypothetical protein
MEATQVFWYNVLKFSKKGGVVAKGDVVAQLVKATEGYQTEDAAVSGSNPAPLIVS